MERRSSFLTTTRVGVLGMLTLSSTRPGLLLGVVSGRQFFESKSGIKSWVDKDTPLDAYTKMSSRGEPWTLVMSDEFNQPGRSFLPGDDPIWTSLDLADGVNSALEYYSSNMTNTTTDLKTGEGILQLTVVRERIDFEVYNLYKLPDPGFDRFTLFYRGGMIQSWNKFCFQGGIVEVRTQLPGATGPASGNPDLAFGPKERVRNIEYYPTWPGIWFLGNLGRAIFGGSTNRMWPWSFDNCDDNLEADPAKNQRISACDSNPGSGLNPNQGRGAPEIDLIEGGGTEISASIQVAPGMIDKYRLRYPSEDEGDKDDLFCFYQGRCETPGANSAGIPTDYFARTRGYDTWYQGLLYAGYPCETDPDQVQSASVVREAVEAGLTTNTCDLATCPFSRDPNGAFGPIDGKPGTTWNVNTEGNCFPVVNGYKGVYLCDPDNQDDRCTTPRPDGTPKTNLVSPFNYQMDALSSNYPITLDGYTDYLRYQLEWVPGPTGYIRWMLEDVTIFEIPSVSLTNPPQERNEAGEPMNDNPKKVMVEEPMYIIFNLAVSTAWGAFPPNAGSDCAGAPGNDTTATNEPVCNEFPMALKLDYFRLWQRDDMVIGCDPASHPTAEFIRDNLADYTDVTNTDISVAGGGSCTNDYDCTTPTDFQTGQCVEKRCVCFQDDTWGGPRCVQPIGSGSKGPPPILMLSILGTLVALTLASLWMKQRQTALNPDVVPSEAETATANANTTTSTHPPNEAPSAMSTPANEPVTIVTIQREGQAGFMHQKSM